MSQKRANLRGFAPVIILIAIVVGLVVAGAYWFGTKKSSVVLPGYSPTPTGNSEMSGWKTYTNTSLGYSIRLPSEWEKDQNIGRDGVWYFHKGKMPQDNPQHTLSLFVSEFEIDANDGGPNDTQNLVADSMYKDQCDFSYFSKNIGTAIGVKAETTSEEAPFLGAQGFKQAIGTNEYRTAPGLTFRSGIACWKKSRVFFAAYYKNFLNTKDDKIFDQILSTFKFVNQNESGVKVTTPAANAKVTSPLRVAGTVPADWFFEGQLMIKLLDEKRNLIAQGVGQETVPGSWQMERGGPLEFEGKIIFTTSAKSGFLVIGADNPSGLPENEKNFEVPVSF